MYELKWMEIAKNFLGQAEVKGTRHNPKIIAMLEEMGKFSQENKAWWRDDETPWCGLFVGYCIGKAGRWVVPQWYRALAWTDNRQRELKTPAYGAIAVRSRSGGGHVGFVAGINKQNKIVILGGNQNDRVCYMSDDASRYRYFWASHYIDGEVLEGRPAGFRYQLEELNITGYSYSLS